MMVFSVLMSVYERDNPVHYDIALRSVTERQIVKPNQVVIVYDGPVPQGIDSVTKQVVAENPDIEFTVIRNNKNQGLASALNCGLRQCKFEYVARMDADDFAVQDRFLKQKNFLEQHPEVDVLGGRIAEFAKNPHNIFSIRDVGLTHEEIVQMAKHRTPFNHMTVMYKKEKVLAVGGYNTDFGKLEDYKLWVDMIAAGCRFSNLEDILIHMRIGNGFFGRRSNKREILDWDNLQNDLIEAKVINRFEAIINKIYIRAFIYMPEGLKKAIYKVVLRRNV